MHIVTYATDINHINIKYLKQKIPIHILTDSTKWTKTFYAKHFAVNKFIQNFDMNELILCCDAYDVMPMNNCSINKLEDSINLYFDLNKITFNAETNCYPDKNLIKKYPHHDSKWKFLNAGIYVGTVKNILKLYEKTLDSIKHTMDQLIFTIEFLESKNTIDLDYECKVFQTLFNIDRRNMNIDDFIIKDKILVNKYFNTTPLLFHGNGRTNMSKLLPYTI